MRRKYLVLTLAVGSVVLFLSACQKKTNSITNTSAAANINTTTNQSASSGTISERNTNRSQTTSVNWMQTQEGWQPNGTPPACPNPANLIPPVDLTKVTSILYPGQTRGGNYKPHGGFRMDTATSNEVVVTIPMAGEVIEGSRYLVNGETQYMFDIMTPCGLMFRFGHLLKLTQAFQAIAETFPAPQENDSRTTQVQPSVAVTAGEQIATAVGVTVGGRNVFFDFGVYDYNQKNAAAANATWAASHDPQLAQHAVCWFDLFNATVEAKVRALPAGDPTSGKKSDYCS